MRGIREDQFEKTSSTVELFSVMFVHSGFCCECFFFHSAFLAKIELQLQGKKCKRFFSVFLVRFFFFLLPTCQPSESESPRVL